MTSQNLTISLLVLGVFVCLGPSGADNSPLTNDVEPFLASTVQPSRMKLLFMDEQDVRDVWGRVVFASNPLLPIAGASNFDMENLVNVENADGSWTAYGMNWVGGEIPRRPRPGSEYLQVKAKTTNGFQFTDRVQRPWDGEGPGTELFLQKSMAYNPEANQWLLLYSQFQSPQGDGYPLRAYVSNDGLEFTELPESPVYGCHDALHVMWDPLSKDYLCYQISFQPWVKKYPDNAQQGRRVVTIRRSSDGASWYPPANNIVPDDFDPEYLIVPDANDPEDLEFYWFTPFPYADRFIGLMLLYEPGPPEVNPRNPGVPNSHGPLLATEWWISRDAIHWSRPYQHQYLGLEPDQGLRYANGGPGVAQCNPIVTDNQILFIGRGRQQVDRIACAAGAANTEFSSNPFRMPPVPMFLNATARWMVDTTIGYYQGQQAYIMVELLDSNGQTIPGYNKERCYFQDVDALDLPLVWNGNDGTALAGQTVSLRFYIRDARVYAVTTKEAYPNGGGSMSPSHWITH